jgi:hypothetical protein
LLNAGVEKSKLKLLVHDRATPNFTGPFHNALSAYHIHRQHFFGFSPISKVDREFNSMNIQRRNVLSERILILFSNTTYLFSVAVSKDFPFPSVPKLYTAIASSSIYRMTVLTTIAGKSRQWR